MRMCVYIHTRLLKLTMQLLLLLMLESGPGSGVGVHGGHEEVARAISRSTCRDELSYVITRDRRTSKKMTRKFMGKVGRGVGQFLTRLSCRLCLYGTIRESTHSDAHLCRLTLMCILYNRHIDGYLTERVFAERTRETIE